MGINICNRKELWAVISNITSDVFGFISKVSELAGEQDLMCNVWVISENLTEAEILEIYEAGAELIYHLPINTGDCNQEINVRNYLANEAIKRSPETILFLSSIFMNSVAPGIAALLHTGITADCTQLYWNDVGELLQCRPTFGGRKLATIQTMTRPVIATVRSGVFMDIMKHEVQNNSIIQVFMDEPVSYCQYIGTPATQRPLDIRGAEVILAGGAGLGSKENFDKIYGLASKLKGTVVASRGAVANGYAAYDRQVGQTGISVNPRIYVAFGISGAVQHLCGMIGSEMIIAVNPDQDAPIHKVSDYSIYEDANKVIEILLNKL